ncbi:pyridoxal phosphate-dependent aminotransferase [Variovorax ginsengisoli]|uniref:Aminotransferase n=1 Tax=Variovorax ginsengisoli TaxID=363844 RepID=A0ABT8RVZ4_9BURK|nr:pyridoxal phosphate-dependent aminotransferase [Variovorax ginsengisoli]MDN8611587.1 pyridoxal phosphate-dependent aminotransferase [Variovorax ginsengisoli]MDO1530757.1 pyridoxal phosphate-dependent aminotransferase [Variovorax ginsengisoli]
MSATATLAHEAAPAPAFAPSQRIRAIGVSEILRITDHANALRRAGRPVIVLGAGEPDFETPEHIRAAATRAIARGETRYTVLDGSNEMKTAVRHKFQRDNALDYALDEISVSAGAKQVIFNALMASLEPGDEVILPAPYWTSYADIVRICGGVPVVLPCSEARGFRLDAGQLDAAITPRTRWVFLNSPSNPSGTAYSAAQLRPLTEVLLRHPQVWLLADDIYEHILYDGLAFATPAAVEPGLRERTLTVNGVSKAYAMTGWRIGYGAGPRDLIAAMAVVQSQSTSCPSSVSQAAAIEALTGSQALIGARRADFEARRDVVVEALNAIRGLHCRRPEGAFYTYASCAGVLGRSTRRGMRLQTDADFCRYLLEDFEVAVVPGSVFGLAPYFRISYATSMAQLQEACARISAACAALE